jgi:hypothetical protein
MDLETLLRRTKPRLTSKREPVPHDLNEPRKHGHVTHGHNPHMMVRYGSRTDHAQSIKHTRAECEQFAHLLREVPIARSASDAHTIR